MRVGIRMRVLREFSLFSRGGFDSMRYIYTMFISISILGPASAPKHSLTSPQTATSPTQHLQPPRN